MHKQLLVVLCAFTAVLSVNAQVDKVVVEINVGQVGSPINPRFASYSYEYGGLPSVAGTSPNLRPSFFQLMNNIKEYTGASPQFRIGGNSADTSWWNPNDLPAPNKFITYSIKPAEIQTIQDVTQQLSTVATLSVNLDNSTNTSMAVDYMKAVQQQIGFNNIYGIEIGNEVDLFGSNGFRPEGYSYAQYQVEFDNYVAAIAPYIPKKFIQGATFCCLDSFFSEIPSYVATEVSKLRTVSVHNYPTTHCGGNPVQLLQLMQDKASQGVAEFFAPYAKATIEEGLEFWIGEMNSASCGGAPNVSDVFGSALWAVDILFNYVNIGVKGVNFHGGSGGYYTSFAYSNPTSQVPEVRPIYYGQYLFAQAIRNSSALANTTIISSTNDYVKVWSLEDQVNNHIRVVVIHKDITTKQSANVTIQISKQYLYSDTAQLLQVLAPSPWSQTGITIGSQTFDGTQTGAPVGTQVTTPITAIGGTYTITVPPASIAMLTLTSR